MLPARSLRSKCRAQRRSPREHPSAQAHGDRSQEPGRGRINFVTMGKRILSMTRYIAVALLAALATLTGCVNADEDQTKAGASKSAHAKSSDDGSNHSVNGSIRVTADQKKDDASTVNGSIHVADNGAVA